MISHGSQLWVYLSDQEKILADNGAFLVNDSEAHKNQAPTDYSYLVFPFAKLFEGFLKDALYDLKIISRLEYQGSHFRIGKVLSPSLVRRLGKRSAFAQIEARFGKELALTLWNAWKDGRNLIFHYYPSDFRLLSREQALEKIQLLVQAMEACIERTNVRRIS